MFVVSVDSSGQVTLDQQRAVVHPDTTNPDDSTTLSAANLVVLTATATDKRRRPGFGRRSTSASCSSSRTTGRRSRSITLPAEAYGATSSSTWTEAPGADAFKSLNITLNSYTIDSKAAVTVDTSLGTATTVDANGNYVFNGSITADFTDDGIVNNQTVTFKLTFDPDDGTPADGSTYYVDVTSPPASTTTISTANGTLGAGGPDPVQTLTIGSRKIVFSAVDATAPVN